MPHLRFYGFDDTLPGEQFLALIPRLAEIIACPEDWITLEIPATRFLTPPAPMVEVLWFPRGWETQDRAAAFLNEEITRWSGASPTVVFFPLEKENYYEDGRHF